MRLYLDMCCLKRPFDDQTAARIQIETLAVEAILQLCREGAHDLLTSDALQFENSRNPNADRRSFAAALLALAKDTVPHSDAIEKKAAVWQAAGVALLDSLHLASAEAGGASIFCTCDDGLLKKAAAGASALQILSVTDAFEELVP